MSSIHVRIQPYFLFLYLLDKSWNLMNPFGVSALKQKETPNIRQHFLTQISLNQILHRFPHKNPNQTEVTAKVMSGFEGVTSFGLARDCPIMINENLTFSSILDSLVSQCQSPKVVVPSTFNVHSKVCLGSTSTILSLTNLVKDPFFPQFLSFSHNSCQTV